MKLIIVEELPKIRKHKYSYAEMQAKFEEFMKLGVRLAKVEFAEGEYSSIISARNVMARSAKTHGFPIKVMMRNYEVYFERLDMSEMEGS